MLFVFTEGKRLWVFKTSGAVWYPSGDRLRNLEFWHGQIHVFGGWKFRKMSGICILIMESIAASCEDSKYEMWDSKQQV